MSILNEILQIKRDPVNFCKGPIHIKGEYQLEKYSMPIIKEITLDQNTYAALMQELKMFHGALDNDVCEVCGIKVRQVMYQKHGIEVEFK